jgi:hypothetical protein
MFHRLHHERLYISGGSSFFVPKQIAVALYICLYELVDFLQGLVLWLQFM